MTLCERGEHNLVPICDGQIHVDVCTECGATGQTEPCPDAGTWPTVADEGNESAEVWVVAADRDSGLTIVRTGFQTAREAAMVRSEIERHLDDDDTSNFLILTKADAERMIAEDKRKAGAK